MDKKTLPALYKKCFKPKEERSSSNCIWCGKIAPFNKAHIIPESLIPYNDSSNILKRSVCVACNDAFGKFEDWLMKYSPLLMIRNEIRIKMKKGWSIKHIPVFVYNFSLKHWLVVHISSKINPIPQVILCEDGKLLSLVEDDRKDDLITIKNLTDSNRYYIDENANLPISFRPCAILVDGKLILIVRERDQIDSLVKKILSTFQEISSAEDFNDFSTDNFTDDRIQMNTILFMCFKWSDTIWAVFCAKIAFEYLSLALGKSLAMNHIFDDLRKWILNQKVRTMDDVGECNFDSEKELRDFHNEEIKIDLYKNAISSKRRTDTRKGKKMTLTIYSEDDGLVLFISIGWLPSVFFKFEKSNIQKLIHTNVFYDFDEGSLVFAELGTSSSYDSLSIATEGEPFDQKMFFEHTTLIPFTHGSQR